VKGYRDDAYGEQIADVYDDWFADGFGSGSTAGNVAFLDSLLPHRPGAILELAVGTGRLAIPLARLGHDVTGIDISTGMLDRLRANDAEELVGIVEGDMVDDLPTGPFDLVYVAFNSLFMLAEPDRQAACFEAVSRRLDPRGAFVVEAFVPWDPPRGGSHVEVRSLAADRVVLAADITDAAAQIVHGQFIELADGQPVRLRPYVLRWSRPAELDGWAEAAGLALSERFGDVERAPFTDDSPFHVSVYRASSPTSRDLMHQSGRGRVVS
jgi:SAM-dependent methyltransferase